MSYESLLTDARAGARRVTQNLFVKPTGKDGFAGRSFGTAFATLQAAHDAALAGAHIHVAPGDYESLVVTKDNLSFFGHGGPGAVAVAPAAADATAILVDGTTASGRVENLSLHNIGGQGNGTGGGLHLKGNIRRVRAYDSEFEASETGAFAVKLESTAAGAVGDTRLYDCEYAWADKGILVTASGGGDPVTQTRVRGGLLHNIVTAGVHGLTVETKDLWFQGLAFGNLQDGTEPTDYILADVVGTTGLVEDCRFAAPTITAAKMTIAAGVKWVKNYSEAGLSAARPA